MIDIKDAIKTLSKSIDCTTKFNTPRAVIIPLETAQAALAAMREQMKRSEGCDTCKKGQAHFGDVLWAINKDGKAVININGEQANTVFPCCPNCGQQLKDTEQAMVNSEVEE